MNGILTFGDVVSSDYGIYVFEVDTYNAPIRSVEVISIAGRNGDLIYDNGNYENIDIEFHGVKVNDYGFSFDEYRAAMASQIGYHRIEESMHPDEFRIGYLSNPIESTEFNESNSGSFDITFNCKPQRYLRSGELPIEYTEGGSIYNPTHFEASPLIRVYGYGNIWIGGSFITVREHSLPYIDIDFDTMDAYYGSTNANIV